MSLARNVVILVFGLTLSGCEPRSNTNAPPTGEQSCYSAQFMTNPADGDTQKVLAEGTLTILSNISGRNTFDGSWTLHGAVGCNVGSSADADFIAPLSGTGTLVGNCVSHQVLLELYPGLIDNNVELILSREMLGEGRWRYLTDAGPIASGVVIISTASVPHENVDR